MKVRIAPRASREIDAILDYLAVESPSAEVGFATRLDEVLMTIASYPLAGRATNRRHTRLMNTEPYPYLVYYRALRAEIEIVAIRHGARDPRSMPARPR
ncbi:type II toxin-antitoxin system RelE/ParE family toxin [Mesorhizobium australicum]|uniref:Plasmid stabilization system protein ParE n=1 Tax=Mesorhizobium australicum TaxID=536018 RepID=A0A1X7PIW6_9HYPH|nr:type II toxin-antitoxin system RelE/ParE family toxin [Mesorhizobium australicum]SMH50631.1 Plasmid stabilization system protein ParE [Mesorhizobium australicum]